MTMFRLNSLTWLDKRIFFLMSTSLYDTLNDKIFPQEIYYENQVHFLYVFGTKKKLITTNIKLVFELLYLYDYFLSLLSKGNFDNFHAIK